MKFDKKFLYGLVVGILLVVVMGFGVVALTKEDATYTYAYELGKAQRYYSQHLIGDLYIEKVVNAPFPVSELQTP